MRDISRRTTALYRVERRIIYQPVSNRPEIVVTVVQRLYQHYNLTQLSANARRVRRSAAVAKRVITSLDGVSKAGQVVEKAMILSY